MNRILSNPVLHLKGRVVYFGGLNDLKMKYKVCITRGLSFYKYYSNQLSFYKSHNVIAKCYKLFKMTPM